MNNIFEHDVKQMLELFNIGQQPIIDTDEEVAIMDVYMKPTPSLMRMLK